MSGTTGLPIAVLLSRVADGTGAVRKGDHNSAQGFSFRGVDAVVKAVYPHLVANGVVVVPHSVDYEYGQVEVGARRTPMGHARVVVTYRFYGPAGDWIDATAPGEAMDSGDKATAKAMSVAYRTALLQALSLPTDDPDPDHTVYERSEPEALSPGQEAAMNELTEAVRGCDDVEHLRGLWGDVTKASLPEPVKQGLFSLINDRKRALDAADAAAAQVAP